MFEEKIAVPNGSMKKRWQLKRNLSRRRTYTVDEIQDILGISRASAYNLVKKGLFHYVRIGCTIRISKKSFDEWLDNQL